MRSAAAKTASPWGPSSCSSAVWLGIAKRTFETAALLARPMLDDAQKIVIGMHAKALRGSVELVPNTAREELDMPLKNFGGLRGSGRQKFVQLVTVALQAGEAQG